MNGAEEVDDDEPLLRRAMKGKHLARDGTVLQAVFFKRIPGGAARPDPEASVSRHRLTSPASLVASQANPRQWAVVEFVAGVARGLGLEVRADPLPTDPGHALVAGLPESDEGVAMCLELARACQVVLVG